MSRRRSRERDPPWWAEPGPQICEHCLVRYHVEMGYHCGACDEPVCPACVVVVRGRRETLCPRCAGGAD